MAETFNPSPTTRATKPPARHVYSMVEGPDTFIAESPEHASELLLEHCGVPLEETGDEWMEVPSDKTLIVGFETDDDIRDQLRDAGAHGLDIQKVVVVFRARGLDWLASRFDRDYRCTIEAPASWWAGLPAGFLCSTEW